MDAGAVKVLPFEGEVKLITGALLAILPGMPVILALADVVLNPPLSVAFAEIL